jgi:penicillin-binding protein 1C
MRLALLRAAVLLAAIVGAIVARPLDPDRLDPRQVASVRVLDRDGGLLREVRSGQDALGVPLPGGRVPPLVRDAFLAAEDHRFLRHPGVDGLAVARAVAQDARSGRVVSGASTVTMQLERLLWAHPRSLGGKLVEAVGALRLEAHLSKEQVLVAWLDRVPLGGSVVGVETAARAWFGRSADRLTLAQAAALAACVHAPARLDPRRHAQASRAAAGRVLDRMVALGWIGADEADRARTAPLDLVGTTGAFAAPHLVDGLLPRLGDLGLGPAIEVRTTLDPALQADVEAIVREEVAALAGRGVTEAAALVVDVPTGEVLALVGSVDFGDALHAGQVDGTRARRQPGSALKPFAYGLALASGWTPASVLPDTALHLGTPTGSWSPGNYDGRLRGPVRLREALASSYNVPAVRLVEALGVDRVLDVLRRAGLATLDRDADHYGAGVVLGNGEVTLRGLATAWLGLARGGVRGALVDVRAATDAAGRPLPVAPPERGARFLPEDAVALLTDVLADEVAREPAFGVDHALRLPFPVAAKTGTSHDHVDNWTVGFTRERLVAVWAGNFDGAPMRGVSGISGAGPIFRRAMLRAMDGIAPAPLVDRGRFAHARVCPVSGAPATHACPGALDEVFLPGTVPTAPCPLHGAGVDVGTFTAALEDGGGERPRFLAPGDGATFVLDPGLPLADQAIPVRVHPPAGVTRVELRGDGGVVALDAPFRTTVAARAGAHALELWVPGADAPLDRVRWVVR